jgi:hypothetical protein
MDFTEHSIAMLTPEQVRNISKRLVDLEAAIEMIADETPARLAAAKRLGWKLRPHADLYDDGAENQAILDEAVAARYAA